MSLRPTLAEQLARARADLRMGLPVVLTGGGAAVLAAAAETLDADRLADLRVMGGDLALAITAWRAETLKARAYDDDLARLAIPPDAGLGWIRAVADPADDLRTPMKGPFRSLRDNDAALARAAIQLAKSAHLLPAAVVLAVPDGVALALREGLTLIPVTEAAAQMLATSPLHPVVSARLPMQASEAGRVHIFRPEDGGEEHYAIEIGKPDRAAPVLVRLHSACFTGDVLGSLKCDCGPQLHAALGQMGAEGAGMTFSQDWFRFERLMVAARCVGAAQRLLDEVTAFARDRVVDGKPLGEHQLVAGMLADSATELFAARTMLYEVARSVDAGSDRKTLHAQASMAKLYCSEMAGRAADRAVQIFGGRGYMRENVAERMYRELRVERIWEGASEIQRLIVGRQVLNRGASTVLEGT